MAMHALAQLAVHVDLDAHDPPTARLTDVEGELALVAALDVVRLARAAAAPLRRLAQASDRQDQLRRVLRVVPDLERAAEAAEELRHGWREVRSVARLEGQTELV